MTHSFKSIFSSRTRVKSSANDFALIHLHSAVEELFHAISDLLEERVADGVVRIEHRDAETAQIRRETGQRNDADPFRREQIVDESLVARHVSAETIHIFPKLRVGGLKFLARMENSILENDTHVERALRTVADQPWDFTENVVRLIRAFLEDLRTGPEMLRIFRRTKDTRDRDLRQRRRADFQHLGS